MGGQPRAHRRLRTASTRRIGMLALGFEALEPRGRRTAGPLRPGRAPGRDGRARRRWHSGGPPPRSPSAVERSPISTTLAWRGSGTSGGRLGGAVRVARFLEQRARRARSHGDAAGGGRMPLPSSADPLAAAHQQAASASSSSSARSALVRRLRCERVAHRRRAVAPQPDAFRRLPFGLADEEVAACARSGASRSGWRCRRAVRAGTARRSRPGRRGGGRARPAPPSRRRARPRPAAAAAVPASSQAIGEAVGRVGHGSDAAMPRPDLGSAPAARTAWPITSRS